MKRHRKLPHRSIAHPPEDDWVGVTNPATRRRLQNRLNQRAYREHPYPIRLPDVDICLRREARNKQGAQTSSAMTGSAVQQLHMDAPAHCDSMTCTLSEAQHTQCTFAPPNLHELMAQFKKRVLTAYVAGSPRTDLLLNLSRLNVLRAAYENVLALGMTVEWMCQDNTISIFSVAGPPRQPQQPSTGTITIPQSLRPTHLQRTTPHHPWLDIFPFPQMRDNMILAGDTLDDDELCHDLTAFWDTRSSNATMLVTEEFARKWRWFLRGCPEILVSTNRWRGRRGERPVHWREKAVITTSAKTAEVASNRRIPTLLDDSILVKTTSVALNPTDWKHIDFLAPPGVVIGCDYAGTVVEVGKDVKKPFKKGDRICGFVHGSNTLHPEVGAFAEYILVKGDLQYGVPEGMRDQEAATVGLGVTTAALGLYRSLGLALPSEPVEEKDRKQILVYGGSTATGTLAIQFAKLSGYEVLTTCSARHFDRVKELGADAVFDYNEPNSASAIKAQTNDGLTLAFDTVSVESSAKYCDLALSSKGGQYSSLLPIKIERENVQSRSTMAYTVFGEKFIFGPKEIPAQPEDRAFMETFCGVFEDLLASGRVKVHPPRVCDGGLDGILNGLQLLREGKVSGEKLVYNI
ncbi:NAD(P)-binding protein [Aspergillus carlsbadensis]|nr:NAD(P)-binding protein [Aspergillus carlsbadensis]